MPPCLDPELPKKVIRGKRIVLKKDFYLDKTPYFMEKVSLEKDQHRFLVFATLNQVTGLLTSPDTGFPPQYQATFLSAPILKEPTGRPKHIYM